MFTNKKTNTPSPKKEETRLPTKKTNTRHHQKKEEEVFELT